MAIYTEGMYRYIELFFFSFYFILTRYYIISIMSDENDYDASSTDHFPLMTPLGILKSVREHLTDGDVKLAEFRYAIKLLKLICCESSSVVSKFKPPCRNTKLIYKLRERIDPPRGANPNLIDIFKLCRRITTANDGPNTGTSSVVMVLIGYNYDNPIPYKVLYAPSSQKTATVPLYGQLVKYSIFGNIIGFEINKEGNCFWYIQEYSSNSIPHITESKSLSSSIRHRIKVLDNSNALEIHTVMQQYVNDSIHMGRIAFCTSIGQLVVFDYTLSLNFSTISQETITEKFSIEPEKCDTGNVPKNVADSIAIDGPWVLVGFRNKYCGLYKIDTSSEYILVPFSEIELWIPTQISIKCLNMVRDVMDDSGDTCLAVAGDRGGYVNIWLIKRSNYSEKYHYPVSFFKAHTCEISSIAINIDGCAIATGGQDGNMAFWRGPWWDYLCRRGNSSMSIELVRADDLAIGYFVGHTNQVTSLAFYECNGEQLLVSGSTDGTVGIWDGSKLLKIQEGRDIKLSWLSDVTRGYFNKESQVSYYLSYKSARDFVTRRVDVSNLFIFGIDGGGKMLYDPIKTHSGVEFWPDTDYIEDKRIDALPDDSWSKLMALISDVPDSYDHGKRNNSAVLLFIEKYAHVPKSSYNPENVRMVIIEEDGNLYYGNPIGQCDKKVAEFITSPEQLSTDTPPSKRTFFIYVKKSTNYPDVFRSPNAYESVVVRKPSDGELMQFHAISISHMIYFLLYKATQLHTV